MRLKLVQDVATSEVRLMEHWPENVDPCRYRFLGYTVITLERRQGRGFEQIPEPETTTDDEGVGYPR